MEPRPTTPPKKFIVVKRMPKPRPHSKFGNKSPSRPDSTQKKGKRNKEN